LEQKTLKMKKRTIKKIGIGLLVLVIIVLAGAKIKRVSPLGWGHKQVNTPMFSDEAINGYDPVAYFTTNKAVKGDEAFTHSWNGGTWYLSSRENLDLFKSNPEKYAPQFGGYCAFATSKGFTANTDPEAFQIIGDKVYLFADEEMLENWMEGGEESKEKSEQNWGE